jgi:hypothetical protein
MGDATTAYIQGVLGDNRLPLNGSVINVPLLIYPAKIIGNVTSVVPPVVS